MVDRWTVASVLAAADKYLAGKNSSAARLEAELLLAHSLDISRFDLYTQFDRPLSPDERAVYRSLIKERASGRPVQHLIGTQPFRHLNLKMAPGVFIPRPETELLVEQVLTWLATAQDGATVLDLGTGSGAICVALAMEAAGAQIWTVDISERALTLAQANAAAHGVSGRMTFRRGDLFAGVPQGRRFSAIVANPPYIPTAEIETLEPQVRDHEPREALDGGLTGLDFYQRIIADAPDYLLECGFIAFEVGEGQADTVANMLRLGGFGAPGIHKDYAGIDRIVTAHLEAGC